MRKVLLIALLSPVLLILSCGQTMENIPKVSDQIWGTKEQIMKAFEQICVNGPCQYGVIEATGEDTISKQMDEDAAEIGELCKAKGYNENYYADYEECKTAGKVIVLWYKLHRNRLMEWIAIGKAVYGGGMVP